MKLKFTLFPFIILLVCNTLGYSEGTKQIMPTNTGIEKIYASSPTGTLVGFAYYSCPPENRLNIHIKQLGEVIYYGFQKEGGSHQFRIKDPDGNIVVGPTNVPTTGTGFISTYDQAVAGPSQIAGAGGYDAFLYTPLMIGDFYIEFNNNTTFLYFDITVADVANAKIDGRIWSKAWQFDTGDGPGSSFGTYFIYTDDGLVSSMDLNGLQGITFTVACNQVGCPVVAVPGTFTRKSVNGKHVIPQYKIFLNDPDITEYPTGTLGELTNLLVTWNCDGTATITFDVNKNGDVDILLDINPLPGVQAEDVVIQQSVTIGANTIPWNGQNGLGNQVPNGTTFNITVTYILGLTNFPVYDVEANANGLIVNLVRPTGGTLLMYWDDTDLVVTTGCSGSQVPPVPDPISNYAGCPGSGGCHVWTSVGGNPGQCSYGNVNTVNTYWYAVYSTFSWPDFVVHRFPGIPESPVGPLEVCTGDAGKTYTISPEPNSDTYTWEYTGTGATFNPPNPTGTSATLDFAANATSGIIRVRGWNVLCGDGPLWSDPTSITVIPVPAVTSPLTASNCSGNTFQTTLLSDPPTTTFNWTVDCSPEIVTCPPGQVNANQINDFLSVSGITAGTVNYHITPTSGICSGTTETLVVTVAPQPNISSPSVAFEDICSGSTTNIVLESVAFPTAVINWEVLPGGCDNILNCPASGTGGPITDQLELADPGFPGSVVYTITPNVGGCLGIPVQHTVNVLQLPDVQLPGFAPVCLNTPAFTLNTGTPSGGTYTLGGNPLTIFDPGAAGVGTHTITYTFTDGNGCTNSDVENIIVQSLITPSLLGDPAACLGVSETFTTDPGMVPASYLWSVSPDGTISGAGPDSKSITWPTTGIKTVTVSYTDPNGCATIPASMQVLVNPLPVPAIDPTGNFNVCYQNTYVYNVQPGNTNYMWSVSPGNTVSFLGNTATVTWNVISNNEWIEVNYEDVNGCTAVIPTRVVVIVNPSPVYIVTGLLSVCAGSSSTYNLQGSETGTWSITPGGTITTPVNNVNSISVTWDPGFIPAQSSVIVNYMNALGCLGETTTTIDIQPLPITTFTTTTPSPVCQDYPTPSLYTVDPGGAAANYTWQVTPAANATIANPNANPASIVWKLSGNLPETATLTLTAITSATVPACSATSAPVLITINPKPVTQLTACFDMVTTVSAKPFMLKGGTPLLTGPPQQGEYLVNPPTAALSYNMGTGNYYFDPSVVPGPYPKVFAISYQYTNQLNCIATTATTVPITVNGPNSPCGATMNDYRDTPPTVYQTAMIAGKCWMTENLHYGTVVTNPSQTQPQPQTDNCLHEKYCLSADNANCSMFGGLYQWDELIQYGQTPVPYQGVCPPGWHIPTYQEWQDLIDAVANMPPGTPGDGIAGSYLTYPMPIGIGVQLNGMYYLNNIWAFTSGNPTATMFWTSTLSGSKPIARGMNSINPSVSLYESSKVDAFPVRCVKD